MRTFLRISLASLLLATPTLAQEAMGTFINQDGAEAGTVTLTQGEGSVTLSGSASGLSEGEHGIHFHTTGNCDSATKFESAGDHFNPTDHQHGLENDAGPHAGDLPNITAGADGLSEFEVTSASISLTEGDEGYVFDEDGTALIIHASADDQVTDPSGNSGDRVLCAMVEAAPAP
ncbi:superoxide dismutase family protein [Devosia sp. SD17-2]|jgi:Cu-Zn family superoxide dismutase|uniref:superoxide dismutase family protein n=1 Tax=Devosia sp. SD17-2 TaxID=2976459 RepID=UPI0023D83D40|nr:superoxide dismutase family protein [Devosia sp. SD17-2]WEJ34676.1 superoxide dismutase family protein [Devosia sp. SD17-2]